MTSAAKLSARHDVRVPKKGPKQDMAEGRAGLGAGFEAGRLLKAGHEVVTTARLLGAGRWPRRSRVSFSTLASRDVFAAASSPSRFFSAVTCGGGGMGVQRRLRARVVL